MRHVLTVSYEYYRRISYDSTFVPSNISAGGVPEQLALGGPEAPCSHHYGCDCSIPTRRNIQPFKNSVKFVNIKSKDGIYQLVIFAVCLLVRLIVRQVRGGDQERVLVSSFRDRFCNCLA